MQLDDVLREARAARDTGSRASAWARHGARPSDGRAFERVLEMVRGVRALGLEACATLGMVTADQARRLAEAGLTAYNHNLDTSRGILRRHHHYPDL